MSCLVYYCPTLAQPVQGLHRLPTPTLPSHCRRGPESWFVRQIWESLAFGKPGQRSPRVARRATRRQSVRFRPGSRGQGSWSAELPKPIGAFALTNHSAKSRPAYDRSAPLVDTLRGLPTKPPLASSALLCVEFTGPLDKSLPGKCKVFPIRGLREPGQIPATWVRTPHND